MERGQITIDLLLAFLAVVVFTAVFGAISAQTIASQNVISIQAQQKAIGENLVEIISTSKVLGSPGTGRVVYSIPKIFDNAGKEVACSIISSSSSVVISSTVDLKTISTTIDYVNDPAKVVVPNSSCGSDLTIAVS